MIDLLSEAIAAVPLTGVYGQEWLASCRRIRLGWLLRIPTYYC